MTEEKVIVVENLTKRFGDFKAVDSISFDVKKGEIFGFLGANGAGKTTAMRMLCGLSIPTSGTVLGCGDDEEEDGALPSEREPSRSGRPRKDGTPEAAAAAHRFADPSQWEHRAARGESLRRMRSLLPVCLDPDRHAHEQA